MPLRNWPGAKTLIMRISTTTYTMTAGTSEHSSALKTAVQFAYRTRTLSDLPAHGPARSAKKPLQSGRQG